jgi:hypothetical protein
VRVRQDIARDLADIAGQLASLKGEANACVSTLQHYLRGTDFPADKEEVASNAESIGAPQDLVAQIRDADTERFDSPEEVMQAVQSGLDLG